jgi:hypothetical protein
MRPDPDAEPGEPAMLALGRRAEVVDTFGSFNTSEDGSTRTSGTDVLYGPGFVVEIASGQDDVMQAMIVVQDEDIAWPVLSRLCRQSGWSMTDMESGRVFGSA